MAVRVCRWGVLGSAVIARKFWQSVRLADNSHLLAVASRDPSRARAFVSEAQSRFPVEPAVQVLGSYRELVEHPEIDAVYIPLPTGLRAEWVLAAAASGKHVLCEKPCAVSVEQLDSMIAACETAGVQFMDNVMFMHSSRLQRMKEILGDASRFGQLRRIHSQFSFCAPAEFFRDNIRSNNSLEPFGCLGDLGWYNIRMGIVATGTRPQEVVARFGWDAGEGAPPVEMAGEMRFADGVTASFYCGFVTANQQWVHFSGTNGSMLVDDFSLPWFGNRTSLRTNQPAFNESGWDFNYEQRETVQHTHEYSNGHPSAQEVQLARNFSELVLSGKPDPYWPQIARETQLVMAALMDSANNEGRPVSLL